MVARMIAATKEPPPPPPPPPVRERLPLSEGANPFLNDEIARNKRQEAALSMVDDETRGYILLVLKRNRDGSGEITPHVKMERNWHPSFARVIRRVLDQLEVP